MKHILFVLLFLLLLGPALQAKFQWVGEPTLAGAYHVSEHPTFSAENLTSGKYQADLEKYLEDRIGFRTWLIQLRNQLSFSLLGVARSTDLILGNNVLFQQGPVNAYLGKDFMGEAEIQRRVRRMRIVQDDLAKRGIPFLFMMAPNKGRYQPEDLPYWTLKQKQPLTNYEVFVREMKANQVNLLDFCQLFARWKDTTAYALFPSGGTHWSAYGSTLAADTLFKRIEKLGSFDLVDFRRVGPLAASPDDVRGTDGDLSGPLNLLFGYKHYPMAYPNIVFDSLKASQQRPNMLVSGDSFGAALMQFNPYFQTLFAPESRYWGVEGTVFRFAAESSETGEKLAQLDFRKEVESRQFIMLLITEHNLPYEKFINQLYDLYHPLSEADKARINQIKAELSSKAAWGEENDPAFISRVEQEAMAIFEKEQTK
ncbi:alginate O-acetyltransferase AlgX-related protein [Hymenobacter cellulosivorans]|uniref:AlgX/AlgJ SGNH hydrolase-like domain-containing protein n=1 Tax=Hymenobacter cellulosivorans TaxID=2932249 RepID=A0ABY4FE30_9BACT|nr:hypothetical protein [Hymenobacter cellulosivorans]UOQ54297.1 hypothetical protein MUN80_05945 [Hymenobacter cellulosivorans]